MNFESAILAGGKNSRYGGLNKAFIEVGDVTIIDRNIKVLKPLFLRISIITNHPEQFSNYRSYPMTGDYFHEIGPLAGIHSALKNIEADAVFISSCDMPFLDSSLISLLLDTANNENADVIIPRVKGKIEPLFAVYSRNILNQLEIHIKESENRSIRSFIEKVNTLYIDFEDNETTQKAFININRPEDLDSLKV